MIAGNLQIKKLKYGEVKKFFKGQSTNKWRC